MVSKALAHPIVHFAITAAAVTGLLLCVFPQYFPLFSWVSNYAVQIMLFYLVAGMAFLFLRQPRLTFIFFGGCAILSLFLKFSIKADDIERWRQTVIQRRLPSEGEGKSTKGFKIAHFNASNANDVGSVISAIREADADLLSVHEVTPHWDEWLRDSLKNIYPFRHTMVDIGLFGMAVFSKNELLKVDTFFYREIPTLAGSFEVEGEQLFFLSVHTEPALNDASLRRLREQLGDLASRTRQAEGPVVVFGDFNAVSWSNEIQIFCDSASLQESRTGFMPLASGGVTSFFDLPLDHIFYSRQLQCLGFENVTNGHASKRLGISGTYRIKPLIHHAKKTAQ